MMMRDHGGAGLTLFEHGLANPHQVEATVFRDEGNRSGFRAVVHRAAASGNWGIHCLVCRGGNSDKQGIAQYVELASLCPFYGSDAGPNCGAVKHSPRPRPARYAVMNGATK